MVIPSRMGRMGIYIPNIRIPTIGWTTITRQKNVQGPGSALCHPFNSVLCRRQDQEAEAQPTRFWICIVCTGASPSVKVFPMQLVTWLGSQRTAACCSMIVSLKIKVFPYNLTFIGLWGHGRCLAGDWRACHWNGGKRNSSVCSWNGGRGHLWPAGIVVPSGLREYLAWRQPQSRDQTWWEFQRLVSSEPGLWESRGSFFQYFADGLHVREKTRTCEMDSNGCIPGLKVKRPQEGSHCFPSDRITMRIPFSAPTFFWFI